MTFHETPRFPELISVGSRYGPKWATPQARNFGGYRASNRNWTYPLYIGELMEGVRSQAQLDELVAYYHGTCGPHDGFRFKHWGDYIATVANGTLTTIVTNTTWQMGKTYTTGALARLRKISKPLATGITFTGGGSYTYDYTTGIVTRVSGANPTAWAGEFDNPVQFASDEMLPQWLSFGNYTLAIPIRELRL